MAEQTQNGTGMEQLPDGYKSEHGYVVPETWKIVRFDKCFTRLTRKNTENNQNVLTISAQKGLISQLDYYNSLYASEDKRGYFLLQKGDFAYNKSYSADYAYGAIKQLERYEKGIVSPLYICFSANKGVSADFYRQYFEAGRFNREIYKIAQEGARNHGLLNVSTIEFFSTWLVSPPIAEQRKIAEILAQCDKVIELKQQLLDEIMQLKKAYLKTMFPANGCDKPQIRFPGFTDAWQQRQIGKVANVLSAARVHKGEWTAKGVPFYRSSDVVAAFKGYDNERAFIAVERYNELVKLSGRLGKDDILITGGGSIGIPYVVPDNAPLYSKDADLIWIKKSNQYSSQFLYAYFTSPVFRDYINSISHVGTIAHYTIEQVKATPIMFPSMKEQIAIGMYFQKLDAIITLRQRELEEMKKKKKALAQLLLTGVVRVQP